MLYQGQSQKQQIKILPYQILLLNLYFLNTLELEQRIKNEIDENPFLEQNTQEPGMDNSDTETFKDYQDNDEFMYDDVPDYKTDYQNYFNSASVPNIAIKNYTHFKDDAKDQLHVLDISEDERIKAEYVIDLLNDYGLMDKDLDEVADMMSFYFKALISVADVEHLLSIIQTLEPVGIGTCSIRECLLMQLKYLNNKRPDVKCATRLVQDHYDDIINCKFEKIQKKLNIDEDELRIVLNFIRTLKFHPVTDGSSYYTEKNTIIPDYIITREGEKIHVELYNDRSKSLFVNQSLQSQLLSETKKQNKATRQYVTSKLQSAHWFVNAVKQREDTMLRIMKCLVTLQYDYFLEGDIYLLKPMVLRNVAENTGADISTISRITCNKYAETHFGQICLKDLFSEGIADKKGVLVSNKVIQSIIKEAIMEEDKSKSYTDGQLAKLLLSKGYNIARRTVAKYRELMRIPTAQIRMLMS